MEVVLDCSLIGSKESFFTALSLALRFPGWFGNNLDGLYDCLTDLSEETHLTLRHFEVLEERLGDYGARLRDTLEEAAEENPCLYIEFEE